MSKITQLLQETGAQVQVSTLKELFNKLFASDKDASINKDFWTAEQWEKGISGIPTSSPGAEGEEHWFQVDLFNPLILKIDSKYKTLIEKIEAFVEHVKTVDTNFVTESDPLDDDTLLKRCYETLYQHALRSDFSNLDSPKPTDVAKFIDKLGVQSVLSAKIQNTITRFNRFNKKPNITKLEYDIVRNDSSVSKGEYSKVTQNYIEIAEDIYEYDIFASNKNLVLNSTAEVQHLYFTITITLDKEVSIKRWTGKVQFLQNSKETHSYAHNYIFSLEPNNATNNVVLKIPILLDITTRHTHGGDIYYIEGDNRVTYDANNPPTVTLNNDLFEAFGITAIFIRVGNSTYVEDTKMEGVDWKTTSAYFSEGSPPNNLTIYGIRITGMCHL